MMRPEIITVLIVCCLTSTCGLAQMLTWADISGSMGFSGIYELSDGTMFGRYGEAMVRSTDDGLTWRNFPRPGGRIMSFLAEGHLAVILTYSFEVVDRFQYFWSTNNGGSWYRFYSIPSALNIMMMSPTRVIYRLQIVGGRFAVQQFSLDDWVQIGNPSWLYDPGRGVGASVAAVDGAGTFYIGSTYDGIHSSRDGGKTWTRDLPYRSVWTIKVISDRRAVLASWPNRKTNGGVYLTENGGLNWIRLGLPDVYVGNFEVDEEGNILAGTPSGIFRYRDSLTWDNLGQFDFSNDHIHITKTGKYFATAEGVGMMVSVDSGRTWEPDGVRRQEIYTLCTAPDGSILVGTVGRGIFRSTDGGVRWKRFRSAGQPEYYYDLYPSGDRIFAGTEHGLYRSDDNGQTWNFLTAELDPEEVYVPVYTVAVRPGGALLIGTGTGVYASTDDGRSWLPRGLHSTAIRKLAVAPAHMLYALTPSSGVYASSDDGLNWSHRGLVFPDLQTLAVSEYGRVVVGGWLRTFVSDNEGVSWDTGVCTNGHIYSLLFNGNHQLYAGTWEGLYVSNDGLSWSEAGLNPDPLMGYPGEFVISLAYDQNHSIIVGTYKGGVFRTTQVITAMGDRHELPSVFQLAQNYPNPFNPTTEITYSLPRANSVTLKIYDLLGGEITTLVNERKEVGQHTVQWSAESHPSGIYFYRLTAGEFTETKKMVLMR